MAEPIPFHLPPRDPKAELLERLKNAPRDHAEALLAAYDVLQGLHDKGLLDIAKGALGSGEKIMEIVVNGANSPEVIQGIRNLIILAKFASALDPKLLECLVNGTSSAIEKAQTEKPLGLFQLLGKLTHPDTRRALTVATNVLESVGKEMDPEKASHSDIR